jgi:hypothetical protein
MTYNISRQHFETKAISLYEDCRLIYTPDIGISLRYTYGNDRIVTTTLIEAILYNKDGMEIYTANSLYTLTER